MNRRQALSCFSSAALSAFASTHLSEAQSTSNVFTSGARVSRPIGISSYSLWRFKNEAYRSIEKCLELSSEMGFDGFEILERQLEDKSPAALRNLKSRAYSLGLPLMGLSTHQSFVSPERDARQKNIDLTIGYLEMAYQLGIPSIRVNTGRWGTSANFDALMANRGIEPVLEGYTEEDGYQWVIESFEKLVPEAEKRGVILGLENHWGLGLTPEGVLKIVNAINSPWLKVTLDTGNFLENPYPKLEMLLPHTVLVQAKTYYGGGEWYTLDLDYSRIGKMLTDSKYQGWISLEFEGKDDVLKGAKQSLELFRSVF